MKQGTPCQIVYIQPDYSHLAGTGQASTGTILVVLSDSELVHLAFPDCWSQAVCGIMATGCADCRLPASAAAKSRQSRSRRTMLTLYFARHGETIWNTQSRMQGRLDTALTENGQAQAMALGDRLRGIHLDKVYVSPAPRARRTAELALQSGHFPATLPVEADDRVHEMDLGDWEGLSVDEVQAMAPENLQAFFFSPPDFIPTGSGETYHQVSERMASFLSQMETLGQASLSADREHQVLLVSHNITLKALLALLKRKPLSHLRDGPPLKQAALYRAVYLPGHQWDVFEPDFNPSALQPTAGGLEKEDNP
ncbi:MAG: histidine phosphatase family protein [Clostridia bacterium]|nr:histidine phosphatase family protein [Clostridia bacterium]